MKPLAKPKCFDALSTFIKGVGLKLTLSPANQSSNQEPREPPPPPTPLNFPRLHAPGTENPSAPSKDDLIKLFNSMPRNGPSTDYISALNLQVTHDVELDQLLPPDHLPPSSWLTEPTPRDSWDTPLMQCSNNTIWLSNGAVNPDHNAFYMRAKELLLGNESAFAFLQRKLQPSPGPPIRIAHFRKFWEHLLAMAEYWDTSLDKYITEPESNGATLRGISRSGLRSLSKSPFRKRSRSPNRRSSPSPDSTTRETYTGRRIGCGANMPLQFREDAVCAFVEAIAWAFRCRLERPKVESKLHMGGIILPIFQNASVYRTPKDSQKGRKGVVEGPLMAITCRNVHSFKKEAEEEGKARGEVYDMLKETGLALMIAQKRKREGTAEKTNWEGTWWVERRRWGGGTGKQMSLVEASSLSRSARPGDDVKRVPEKYIKLDPPASTWEKHVEYMQIGKDKRSQYDDIYLVSSLNHHVSILRFRVAQQYTDLISSGGASTSNTSTAEGTASSEQPWFVLSVQRSRWYDLLKVDDRAEAMRGIWGVLAWLMRNTDSEGEEDVQMGATGL